MLDARQVGGLGLAMIEAEKKRIIPMSELGTARVGLTRDRILSVHIPEKYRSMYDQGAYIRLTTIVGGKLELVVTPAKDSKKKVHPSTTTFLREGQTTFRLMAYDGSRGSFVEARVKPFGLMDVPVSAIEGSTIVVSIPEIRKAPMEVNRKNRKGAKITVQSVPIAAPTQKMEIRTDVSTISRDDFRKAIQTVNGFARQNGEALSLEVVENRLKATLMEEFNEY